MRGLLVLCAGLALAGCRDDAVSSDAAQVDACGSAAHQDLIGQPVQALEAAGLVAGPDVRVLGPTSMATMDHRPDRLNIKHDAGGTITEVDCG